MKTRQEKINALNQLVNEKWEIDLGVIDLLYNKLINNK